MIKKIIDYNNVKIYKSRNEVKRHDDSSLLIMSSAYPYTDIMTSIYLLSGPRA